MPAIKVPQLLAELVADLEDPTPKDIDPEELGGAFENRGVSDSGSQDDEAVDVREHYVDVEKSKLRRSEGPSLGPRYSGARVSRDALLADESDDDPFGSGASQQNGLSSEEDENEDENMADPDDLEMDGIDSGEVEDIDSEEAFGEGDEERFKNYKFFGGTAAQQRQDDEIGKKGADGIDAGEDEDIDSDVDSKSDDDRIKSIGEFKEDTSTSEDLESDNEPFENDFVDDKGISDSDDESKSDNGEPGFDRKSDDRALLRQMMASEQKSVVATISQAAKADAAKGEAVIHQSRTFSSLLNTRMCLQKALVAANSLAATPSTPTADNATVNAAEQAALTLWTQLNSLRTSLELTASTKTSQKRPFAATISTPSSALWSEMQFQESNSMPRRRAILQKWSMKTAPASSLPARNKFSNTPTQQPLLNMLDTQLSSPNLERLIGKTQLPSSCAPLQEQAQATTSKVTHADSHEEGNNPHDPIYDDSSFYTLLLRDLVEQKRSLPATSHNSSQPSISLPPPVKLRKKVDTKASKGRKMRYTVHEKLQNFMAREDRCTWVERQVEEFFGGLLGNRDRLGEGDMNGSEEDEDMGEQGLRLFSGGGV